METYNKLIEFQQKYPELTFQNNGYEYLSTDVKKRYAEQIKEISELLKQCIEGFVEFNNFKLRKNGSFAVRVQYQWSPAFTGVGYFNIEDFKELP